MKNKFYLSILFCLIGIMNVSSQIILDKKKCLGGSGDEYLSKIKAIENNCYLLGTSSQSNNGDVLGNHGNLDIWIAKLDSNLNIIWQRCYGGSSIENFSNVFDAGNNQYVFVATTWSTDGDVLNHHSGGDIWVVRIDSSGNILKQNTIGGSWYDAVEACAMYPNHHLAIAAYTNSHSGNIPYYNDYDAKWGFELDTSFNIITQYLFPSDGYCSANTTALITDSNKVLFCEKYWCPGDDYSSAYLNEYDNPNYSFNYLGQDASYNGILEANNGYYTIGEKGYWQQDFEGNWIPVSYAHIHKISSVDNWDKDFIGNGFDNSFKDGIDAGNSEYYLLGNGSSCSGDYDNYYGSYGGVKDIFVMRVDSNGNRLETANFGGTSGEIASNIIKGHQSKFLICGWSGSEDIDAIGNHGGSDAWIGVFDNRYNAIKGSVFIDSNFNGLLDSSEQKLTDAIVRVNQINLAGNINGDYSFYTSDTGTFTVALNNVPGYTVIPSNYSISFNSDSAISTDNSFALQPISNYNDFSISVTQLNHLNKYDSSFFNIQVNNKGAIASTSNISFETASLFSFTFEGATQAPDSINGNALYWNLPLIQPGGFINIVLKYKTDDSAVIGSTLTYWAICNSTFAETDSSNNRDSGAFYIEYYPQANHLWVNIDTIITNQNYNLPDLIYTLTFQNNWNTVATDADVFLLFDVEFYRKNEVEVLESSHRVSINHTADALSYIFHFDSIQLAPAKINQMLSFGYIKYKVKLRDSIPFETTINHFPDVYLNSIYNGYIDDAFTVLLPECSIKPEAIINLFENDSICSGSYVYLIPTGGGSSCTGNYIWYADSLFTSPIDTSKNLSIAPTQTSTYYLMIEDSCGVTGYISKTITVSIPAQITVTTPNGTFSCNDSLPVIATSNQPGSFNWSAPGSIHNSFDSVFFAKTINDYTIAFMNDSGCVVYNSINLEFDNINVDLGPDGFYCPGSYLEASNYFNSYNWSTGNTNRLIQINNSGLYSIFVTDNYGCSATDSIQVTIIDTSTIRVFNICEGDSVFAEGNWQTVSGTYYDYYPTNYGCDTIVITQLNLKLNYNTNTSASICTGDSIFIGGAWQTQQGNYIDNFQTTFGCDSIVETALSINPVFATTDTINIFQGDSVFVGGAWQTVAGVYTDNFLSQNGCDSVVTAVLNILTGINSISNSEFIRIKPNPSSGFVTIEFSLFAKPAAQLTISNLQGQLIFKDEIKSNQQKQIDISSFATGVYILEINCDGKNYYSKLVKE